MKICPICDKKIAGTWCSSCFRFVEPWNITDGIYINERHPHEGSANCDYHSPKINYSKQEYMKPGYEERIYGNGSFASRQVVRERQQRKAASQPARSNTGNRTSYGRTTAKSNATRNQSDKKGGIVKKLIIIYIIFIILGAFMPMLIAIFNIFSEENGDRRSKETEPIYEYATYDFSDIQIEIPELPSREYDPYENVYQERDYSFLDELTVTGEEKDSYGEYTYRYTYFSPDSIKSVGEPCDYEHMNMTFDEFKACMQMVFSDETVNFEVETDQEENYYVESDDFKCLNFSTLALASLDNLFVAVDYDTATEEMHSIYFEIDNMDVTVVTDLYEVIMEIDNTAFGSIEDFAEMVRDCTNDEKTVYSDELIIRATGYGTYIVFEIWNY